MENNKNVFVFCIGGTGLRVMKSIVMLLAAGMKTNGYNIIPILVDPHQDLAERAKLNALIELYKGIYNRSIGNRENKMNPLDGFFGTEIKSLKELDGDQNSVSTDMAEQRSFRDYLNLRNLPDNDINQMLVQTLFSSKNLDNKLSVGFKGNPNVGTVALEEQVNGADWFGAFKRHCEKGDRVFLVSSIFGGTGASGYPLLEKKIRECTGCPNVQEALLGAVTVLPYFKLEDPTTTNSDIDSANFITKTKAALAYYENHVNSDYLYYVGEKTMKANYANNEAEQKDTAHFIELVAASALFDFLNNREKQDKGCQYMTRSIAKDVKTLDLSAMGDGYKGEVKAVADMMMLNLLLDVLKTEKHFPLKKTKGMDKAFYKDNDILKLSEFMNVFVQWYNELSQNERGFSPLQLLEKGSDLSHWIKGLILDGQNESYYLLEMIKSSNDGGENNHGNRLRYLLYCAYQAINHYTNKINN